MKLAMKYLQYQTEDSVYNTLIYDYIRFTKAFKVLEVIEDELRDMDRVAPITVGDATLLQMKKSGMHILSMYIDVFKSLPSRIRRRYAQLELGGSANDK